MSRLKQKYQNLFVEGLGFTPDDNSIATFGNVQGYPVVGVHGGNAINAKSNYRTFIFGLKKEEAPLENKEFRDLSNQSKPIVAVNAVDNKLVISVKAGLKEETSIEYLKTALDDSIAYFKENGYVPACVFTRSTEDLVCGVANSEFVVASRQAMNELTEASVSEANNPKDENVPAGILGALIGSLIGAAAIYLVYKLGYVASITGVLMSIATLALYKQFAGKMSMKGVVISAVLMILMTYLAHRASWASSLGKIFTDGFFALFANVPEILSHPEIGLHGDYIAGLAQLYIFVAIGAIPTIISYYRQDRTKGTTYIMN